MRTHWKIITVSVLIGWFLGAATGLIALHCYHQGGFGYRQFGHMRERLYQDLKLSPEQRTHVDTVMKESREKLEAIRMTTREKIRQKLTSEQQSTFDAANAKMDARRKRRLNHQQKKWDR